MLCSERYATEVSCGNHTFLFTRHDPGDSRHYDTRVRTLEPRDHLLGDLGFSRPHRGLPAELLMSHNAAVICEDDQLVAFGGMAHPPRHLTHIPEAGEDWLGDDVGIMRSVAAPALPFAWSPPQLVISGSKLGTGCEHRIAELADCEYDGKLSVVRWRGRLLLYARSNLRPGPGARHVQLASSLDGVTRWTVFEQLRIDGVSAGDAASNIYFFAVQPLRRRGRELLLGLFPGVVQKKAGVFVTTSVDGLHWQRPTRIIRSEEQSMSRTSEHPVDGVISQSRIEQDGAAGGQPGADVDDEVRVAVLHDVDLDESLEHIRMQTDCEAMPHVCVYRLSAARVFATHDAATQDAATLGLGPRTSCLSVFCNSEADATKGLSAMLHLPRDLGTAPRPLRLSSMAQGGIETAKAGALRLSALQSAARPLSAPAADFAVVEATRRYLQDVYPAAAHSLRALPARELAQRYRSLTYLYVGCAPAALAQIRPRVGRCTPLADEYAAAAPYVPAGAWYRARVRAAPPKPFQESGFDRFARPVAILQSDGVPGPEPFVSSLGARAGPSPSWTSPHALVRYPLHPNGLSPRRRSAASPTNIYKAVATPTHAHAAREDVYFDLANDDRVARLLRVSDGEMLEVEQWGGWATDACPPICGLWANVWKGTGVAMRLDAPFASLNKATAVVEMVLELGRRNQAEVADAARQGRASPPRTATGLDRLADALRIARPARAMCEQHADASFAACVAAQLLLDHPCEAAAGPSGRHVRPWLQWSASAGPNALLARLLQLGLTEGANASSWSGSRRYALHWLFGICGVGGPKARTGHGWDELLASLACMLGTQTVVLAASSNDNGLLHQEVVDYALPHGLGWKQRRKINPTDGYFTNPAHRCLSPFPWARADRHDGPSAEARRRRQLLDFWRRTSKFALPRGASTFAHPIPRYAPIERCELHFGQPDADPAGEVSACRVLGEEEDSPPSATKACWAWCNGTMSRAHAAASLFEVRAGAAIGRQR